MIEVASWLPEKSTGLTTEPSNCLNVSGLPFARPFAAYHWNVVPGIIWKEQLLVPNVLHTPLTPTNDTTNRMLSIKLVPGTETPFVPGVSPNRYPNACAGITWEGFCAAWTSVFPL